MELLHSSLLVRHRSMRVPPLSSTAAPVLMRRRGRLLPCGWCCSISFNGDIGNGDGQDGSARSLCSLVCHPMTVLTIGRPLSMLSVVYWLPPQVKTETQK